MHNGERGDSERARDGGVDCKRGRADEWSPLCLVTEEGTDRLHDGVVGSFDGAMPFGMVWCRDVVAYAEGVDDIGHDT